MKNPIPKISFSGLTGLEEIPDIKKLELINIANEPFYWVNEKQLYNAKSGKKLDEITEQQAIDIVNFYLKEDLEISTIEKIENL